MGEAARVFLGFDFGTRHLGIAVGSTVSGRAEPLASLPVRQNLPEWAALDRIIAEWKPATLIVGLPLNMDDSDNDMTRAARKFGQRLQGRYNLPVRWVDERLTSVDAKNTLVEARVPWKRRKAQVDKLAACNILQAYLDEDRPNPKEAPHGPDE